MNETPKITWSGSFNLWGVEIKCHNLDDGTRIIEEDSLNALFEGMRTKLSKDDMEDGFESFARWMKQVNK